MIIKDPDAKDSDEGPPQGGPSTAPVAPPSFAESTGALAPSYSQFGTPDVFIPQGGEEPPPEFTPYEAEYFVSGSDGDIVSHDRHLNEDGEALYRFLLSHSLTPPTVRVHLRGTHTESRTRSVSSRDKDGHYHMVEEHYTEEVTDFDFDIDVGQHIASRPVHWSLPDEEPAYRGGMVKEVDVPSERLISGIALEGGSPLARRKAAKRDIKAAAACQKEKRARGLPPWAAIDEGTDATHTGLLAHQSSVLKSSKTLREWADEYCATDKLLKEFTYEKVVYGWHLANLEAAISAAIKSTYYTGRFAVEFRTTNAKITVRPDNRLSRTLSNKWLKFILFVLLLYPFIWLYKRFGRRGGGRWEVCGGAYALKTWQLAGTHGEQPPPFPPPPFSGAAAIIHDDRIMQTPMGIARLVGLREGEWFQEWEGTIRRAVTNRLKSSVPLKEPDGRPTQAALLLDGYRPTY